MICYDLTFIDGFTWMSNPPVALTRIQGQSMTLTWAVNVTSTFYTFQINKHKDGSKQGIILYRVQPKEAIVLEPFKSRAADLKVTFSQSGSIANITFVMLNLVKNTDEAEYEIHASLDLYTGTAPTKTQLTINGKFDEVGLLLLLLLFAQTGRLICRSYVRRQGDGRENRSF